MRAFVIRAFAAEDIPAVRALWAACEGLGDGPGDTPAALARFLVRNPGLSQVAEQDGALVGAVLCGHDGRRGVIYRLGVGPAHRRHGIARALVAQCIAGLGSARIERAMLFVRAENAGARAFWESVGGRWREKLLLYSIDL
jgi:ribosomal protein S18 acetylase RimI-like enzyme